MIRHLLSESCCWHTDSVFVDAQGKSVEGQGETHVFISAAQMEMKSWIFLNGDRLENHYHIQQQSDVLYTFESLNPALGLQTGTFHVDQNIVYSKFALAQGDFNGFEVVICHEDQCHAYGALYQKSDLINSWKAVMTCGQRLCGKN